MKSIKILMALLAACILVMPAFSMQDRGFGSDERKNLCDCPNHMGDMLKESNKLMAEKPVRSMMGQVDNKDPCNCPKPMMGQVDEQIQCNAEKQMMGQDNEKNQCNAQKHIMDQNGGQNQRIAQKPMMGQDKEQKIQRPVRSMMGDVFQGDNPMSKKPVKSMMGDRGHDGKGEVKEVVVNLHIIV